MGYMLLYDLGIYIKKCTIGNFRKEIEQRANHMPKDPLL